MSKLIISGGKPLKGEIQIMGAKNAASKLMIASLLTEEECTLENFPKIGDTEITAELCSAVGSELVYGENYLKIKTAEIKNHKVQSLSRRNRIPILAIGPLLARKGEVEVPILGGDKIGPRPVDLHVMALQAFGAEVEVGDGVYSARAPRGLKGAQISFPYPSVGATETALYTSVLASGKTILHNVAIEPEIIDLIKFLQKLGAIIELGAGRTLYIDGVSRLRGATHSIVYDRNEAASFGSLALATKGDIFLRSAEQEQLITFLNAVRRVGGEYQVLKDGIRIWCEHDPKAIEIETDTHPGFMTDWQQPFVVALTQAYGTSVIHETIYEDRFGYTNDLNLMGARITVFSKCLGELPCRFAGKGFMHSAVITGPTSLQGKKLITRDLRSGMVDIIAGLTAEGETEISGVEEIDRGYYNVDQRLRGVGAQIKRISSNVVFKLENV